MKKNFLFSLMAIALAAFSFGGVSLADDVAQIVNGQGYTTLQAAVDATQSGNVVRLLSDITNEHVSISGKNLTLDLDGHMINPSTAGTVVNITNSIVKITGNGKIKNSLNGAFLTVAAHGALSNVTIENGEYESVSTGNTALIYAYEGATITIKGGNFKAAKDATKEGKVIYAGSSTEKDGQQNNYGTMIIEGGIFTGRISDSNRGHYKIRGGIFDRNEIVHYNNPPLSGGNSTNTDTTISFAEAGFLDEGYIITQNGGQWIVSYDPVATIGEKGYSTVTGAIAAATAGQTVEILKAGHYILPNISTAMTIKGNVDGVTFDHEKTNDEDYSISTISANVIFDHISFDLIGMNNQDHKLTNNATITMSGCIFNGYLLTDGTMIFNNCTFNGKNGEYALYIGKGDVTINGGEIIGQNGNIVNVFYYDNPLGTEENNITIEGTRFTNVGSPRKSALNIKEAQRLSATAGHSYIFKYNVTINNVSTYGDFPTDKKGENKIWMVDHLIGSLDENGKAATIIEGATGGSISYGSLNGGNIVITLDGAKVYSTPEHGKNWTVTFDGTGAVEVADGAKVAKPTDPSRSCYRFNGWYNGNTAYNFDAVVTSGLTLTSSWTYTCGGGSSSSSSSSNKTSNKTGSNNTGNNNTGTNNTGVNNTGTVDTGTNNNEEIVTPTDPQAVQENGYTKEFNDAYEFAFANGITTMKNIEEAAMEDGLTRIAMAKMLSQYAINVLKKTPDTSKECKFNDVSEELDAQYDHGVTLACQLGIMGVGITDFRPNDLVVRAEFGTALSRLLFGLPDGEEAYYTTHLAKLKEAGIISNDDPSLEELRGYVMLMLMRSAK